MAMGNPWNSRNEMEYWNVFSCNYFIYITLFRGTHGVTMRFFFFETQLGNMGRSPDSGNRGDKLGEALVPGLTLLPPMFGQPLMEDDGMMG